MKNLKKKKLVHEKYPIKGWKEFLGDDYAISIGYFNSISGKTGVAKLYHPVDEGGFMFLEYENKKSGEKSILLENEWLIMNETNIIHATDFVKRNLDEYFNENLKPLTDEELEDKYKKQEEQEEAEDKQTDEHETE